MWFKTSKLLVSGLALMASFGNVLGDGRSTLLDVAKNEDDLSTFVTAVQIADLEHVLDCSRWYCYYLTAFAPNNAAFEALPSELLGNLTQNPDYKEHLRGILSYHVVWGRETAMDIKDGGSLRTLLHEDVSTSVMDGKIFINDAQVVAGDLTAYNGVLHKLDKVLIPEFMTKNIIQVIYDLGHFNTLRTALDTAGLTSALEGPGPFTLFAPTDAAFDKLGQDAINGLLQDVPTLTDILTYHVIPGRIFTSDNLKDADLTTLQGEEITFGYKRWWWSHYPVLNGEVYFVGFDILASNGVVHVIEQVLTPPSMQPAGPTITELAVATDSLSTLVAALGAAGLDGNLADASFGPVTVFAPTNRAFDDLGQETVNTLLADTNLLSDVLLYHVVDGRLKRSDLMDGTVTALNGDDIEVEKKGWHGRRVILNDDARVRTFDIEASNGIVHIIDKVLIPPSDIVMTATLAGFPTLVKALGDANLAGALKAPGPFTVFAPTEAAFDALGRDVLASLAPADLSNILLYHVVEGELLDSDLRAGDKLKTLEGSDIMVNNEHGCRRHCGLVLNDGVEFVVTNVEATNGVIHAIDRVLIPPAPASY